MSLPPSTLRTSFIDDSTAPGFIPSLAPSTVPVKAPQVSVGEPSEFGYPDAAQAATDITAQTFQNDAGSFDSGASFRTFDTSVATKVTVGSAESFATGSKANSIQPDDKVLVRKDLCPEEYKGMMTNPDFQQNARAGGGGNDHKRLDSKTIGLIVEGFLCVVVPLASWISFTTSRKLILKEAARKVELIKILRDANGDVTELYADYGKRAAVAIDELKAGLDQDVVKYSIDRHSFGRVPGRIVQAAKQVSGTADPSSDRPIAERGPAPEQPGHEMGPITS